MHDRVTANRLAALATALDDTMFAAADGLSESAVAALMVVRRSEPIAIQDIARAVGLTHSATVRLVDRLEKDWLVRRLSRRGREVAVETTARGKRRARDLQERRLARAESLLADLPEPDRSALDGLLDHLLGAAAVSPAEPGRICRFCDQGACRGHADCPVAAAEAGTPAS
ncbi:MarR family transcriptional regulator [Prosthecomicrobium sp. N25]|uniref:MarR family transcriptional regulator n=1 Tax=Prosthecomicrobium sp. N25 TaxID=3129254 RepID=UPI003078A587